MRLYVLFKMRFKMHLYVRFKMRFKMHLYVRFKMRFNLGIFLNDSLASRYGKTGSMERGIVRFQLINQKAASFYSNISLIVYL